MQKKFIINLFFLIGINLLVKPFWVFGIDCTIQNIVGTSEYGLYFAVMNFSFLFGFMLDFGLTGFNNRNVARHEHLASKYTSSILSIKGLLALIYSAFSFIVAFIIGYDSIHFKLLIWLSANQILSSFILFLRSNISGMQMFKTDGLLSILDRLLMILFFSILLWGNIFNIEIDIFYFASFQTLAYFITFLVSLAIVLKKVKIKKLSWKPKLNIVIFKQSLPFALLNFLMLFYYRVDSVMLERLLPSGAINTGIYASAYRILDAFSMFAYLFSIILLPFFSKLLSKKQETGHFLHLSTVLLISTAITVSAIALNNAEAIMNLLYTEHIAESALVLRILMFTFIAISSIYIFGSLLTAHGSMKQLNILAFIGVIINIGLNFILIPQYKEFGAAWSGLITQSIVAIIHIILSFIIIKPAQLKHAIISIAIFAAIIYPSAHIVLKLGINRFFGTGILLSIWLFFIIINIISLLIKNKILLNSFLNSDN